MLLPEAKGYQTKDTVTSTGYPCQVTGWGPRDPKTIQGVVIALSYPRHHTL